MSLLFPIIAILASSILSVNARTYIGCTTNVITGSSNPPSVNRDTTRGCDSYCTFSYPNPYFYFQQSSGLCFCSDASPDAGIYAQGVDDQGGCADTSNYLMGLTTTLLFPSYEDR
ncbi:hypothetical protein I302_101533 [Kwoniella bestiolae CBS 10118]|uniref:WSC domain-containing protein n=1 Tax=Kwoniella bestiolae CBS 10118 TaxID=1296100 RepID=A0AAJ8K1V1_9TREE